MPEPEETIGEKLARLRKAEGVSGVELARRLGVSNTYISHVERGRKTPGLDWLFRCAVAIGVPPSLIDPRLK